MTRLDASSMASFCHDPDTYFLRVVRDSSTNECVVRAESKRSLWTWLKVWLFDRKSYFLAGILSALHEMGTRNLPREFLESLRHRVHMDKYLTHHAQASQIQQIFQEILAGGETLCHSYDRPLLSRSSQQAEEGAQEGRVHAQRKDSLRLPALTKEQREATFGAGPLYSERFKSMCPEYHSRGHLWPLERHILFFREGLLRHYFGTESGFDFDFNYDQFAEEGNALRLSGYDRRKFEAVRRFFTVPEGAPLCDLARFSHLLSRLFLASFPDDHPLAILGGTFQWYKVMTEKLSHLTTRSGNEAHLRLALAMDAEAEKLQTMVYFWMKDWIHQLHEFAKGKSYADLEERLLEFHPPLPSFLQKREYGQLIEAGYVNPLEVRFRELVNAGEIG